MISENAAFSVWTLRIGYKGGERTKSVPRKRAIFPDAFPIKFIHQKKGQNFVAGRYGPFRRKKRRKKEKIRKESMYLSQKSHEETPGGMDDKNTDDFFQKTQDFEEKKLAFAGCPCYYNKA